MLVLLKKDIATALPLFSYCQEFFFFFFNYCICCVSFCNKNKLDIWPFHSMVVICQKKKKSYKESKPKTTPKPKTTHVRRVGFGDDLPS